jgi:hypothetical protein
MISIVDDLKAVKSIPVDGRIGMAAIRSACRTGSSKMLADGRRILWYRSSAIATSARTAVIA